MQLKIDRCKTGIGFLFIFLLLCSALGHSFGESGESLDSPGTETTAEIHIFHKPGGSSTGMTHFVGGFRHNEDGWLPPSLASLFQKAGHTHASEQVVAVRVTGAGLEWQHPVKSVKLCFSGKDPQPGWNILLGKLVRKWWPGSSDEGMADKFYRTISGYQLNQSSEFIVNGKIDTSCSQVSVRDDIRGDIVVPLNAGEAMTNSGFRVEITVVSRNSEKQASLSKSSSPVGLIPPGSANNNNPNLPLTLSSGGFGFDPDPRDDFKPRPAFGVNTDCELTDIQVALEVSDGAVELPEGIHPDDRVYYTHANGGTDPQYYVVINPARLNEIYQQCLGSLAADGLISLYGAIYPGKDVQLQDVVDFLEGNGADPWSGMIMAADGGRSSARTPGGSGRGASGVGISYRTQSFRSDEKHFGSGGGGQAPEQPLIQCPNCSKMIPISVLSDHFQECKAATNGDPRVDSNSSPGISFSSSSSAQTASLFSHMFGSNNDEQMDEATSAPGIGDTSAQAELMMRRMNSGSLYNVVTEHLNTVTVEELWFSILDLNRYFTTGEFDISYSDYLEWASEWKRGGLTFGSALKELKSNLEGKLGKKMNSGSALTESINTVCAAAIQVISKIPRLSEIYKKLKDEAEKNNISLDILPRKAVKDEELLRYCQELVALFFQSGELRSFKTENSVISFIGLIVCHSKLDSTDSKIIFQEMQKLSLKYRMSERSLGNALQLSRECGMQQSLILYAMLNSEFNQNTFNFLSEPELVAAVDARLLEIWNNSKAEQGGKKIRDKIAVLVMDYSRRNILQGQASATASATDMVDGVGSEVKRICTEVKPVLDLSSLPTVGISDLGDILDVLTNRLAFNETRWANLGLALGLGAGAIDMVREDESHVEDRFREMLSLWMRRIPKGASSWYLLGQALDAINETNCVQRLIELKGKKRKPVEFRTLRSALSQLREFIEASSGLEFWVRNFYEQNLISRGTYTELLDRRAGQSTSFRTTKFIDQVVAFAQLDENARQPIIDGVLLIFGKVGTTFSDNALKRFKQTISSQ